MKKKAQSGIFQDIKTAILVLIALVVVIAIFFILLRKPTETIKETGDNVADPNDDLILKINNLLGGCNYEREQLKEGGGARCSFGKKVQCDPEGKWIVIGDCDE